MTEELKQRILAKAAKLSRYEQRTQQYRINRLFKVDKKKVYNEFNGKIVKLEQQNVVINEVK